MDKNKMLEILKSPLDFTTLERLEAAQLGVQILNAASKLGDVDPAVEFAMNCTCGHVVHIQQPWDTWPAPLNFCCAQCNRSFGISTEAPSAS